MYHFGARAGEVARMAAADPTAASNPVPLEAGPLEGLLLDCLEGRLTP